RLEGTTWPGGSDSMAVAVRPRDFFECGERKSPEPKLWASGASPWCYAQTAPYARVFINRPAAVPLAALGRGTTTNRLSGLHYFNTPDTTTVPAAVVTVIGVPAAIGARPVSISPPFPGATPIAPTGANAIVPTATPPTLTVTVAPGGPFSTATVRVTVGAANSGLILMLPLAAGKAALPTSGSLNVFNAAAF